MSPAELELVLEQFFQPAAVHDHQDQIHRLTADLQPEAAARQRQKGGLRPLALVVPGADDPLAAVPAEDKPDLHRVGNDCDGRRVLENGARDRVVGRVHDLLEDDRRVPEPIELIVLRDGQTGAEVQGEPRNQEPGASSTHDHPHSWRWQVACFQYRLRRAVPIDGAIGGRGSRRPGVVRRDAVTGLVWRTHGRAPAQSCHGYRLTDPYREGRLASNSCDCRRFMIASR